MAGEGTARFAFVMSRKCSPKLTSSFRQYRIDTVADLLVSARRQYN